MSGSKVTAAVTWEPAGGQRRRRVQHRRSITSTWTDSGQVDRRDYFIFYQPILHLSLDMAQVIHSTIAFKPKFKSNPRPTLPEQSSRIQKNSEEKMPREIQLNFNDIQLMKMQLHFGAHFVAVTSTGMLSILGIYNPCHFCVIFVSFSGRLKLFLLSPVTCHFSVIFVTF